MWRTEKFYGDVHVVPVGDSRIHTWPMCWCRPVAENVATEEGPACSIMYTHNAVSVRD